MKQTLLKFATVALAVLVGFSAKADLLLTEDFDYTTGDLYNQGSWVKHGTNTNEPIQVVAPALNYAGYQETAIGLSAKLIGTDQTTAHQKLQKEAQSIFSVHLGFTEKI